MSKYCMICRNTACQNHGKNITLFGDSWQCDYIPTPTNADRIRAMSDEELAHQFGAQCPKGRKRECDKRCSQCWLEWLQQPCEGE